MCKETSSELSFGVVGWAFVAVGGPRKKVSSIPRWVVCVEKGCCAVCLKAGCEMSIPGGYDHRGGHLRGLIRHSRKNILMCLMFFMYSHVFSFLFDMLGLVWYL